MMPENLNKSNYWQTLVSELMNCILSVATKNPYKEDQIADGVAYRNLKTYDGKYNPMELEEWIRGMEKIFIIIKLFFVKEKKVNITTFYRT